MNLEFFRVKIITVFEKLTVAKSLNIQILDVYMFMGIYWGVIWTYLANFESLTDSLNLKKGTFCKKEML